MKKTRYTEEQIIDVLKQLEAGRKTIWVPQLNFEFGLHLDSSEAVFWKESLVSL